MNSGTHLNYQLRASDGSLLLINKKKMIFGSDLSCDIQLQGERVSSYHLFLCLQDDGLLVKDLCSEAGVIVNGERIQEQVLYQGDLLVLGECCFTLETSADDIPVFNPDQQITPVRDSRVLVDDEFCHILFDDEARSPLSSIPALKFEGEFLDLDATEEALEIIVPLQSPRLEVISYLSGLISDIQYIPLKEGDYFLTPEQKSSFDLPFLTISTAKLFTVRNSKLSFHPVSDLNVCGDLHEGLFLTHGSEQISLRLVKSSVAWKSLPFLFRDRDFIRQSGKIFAGLFLPLLLLLFVTIPEFNPPAPEPVVIYKLKEKPLPSPDAAASEVSAVQPESTTENTGQKQDIQPSEEVSFSEASEAKEVIAKSAAPETPAQVPENAPATVKAPAPEAPAQVPENAPAAVKTPAPEAIAPSPVQNSPVVAAASPVEVKPAETPKPYQFKSSVAKALVKTKPSLSATSGTAKSLSQASTFNSGSSEQGELVAGASIGASRLNGSDSRGTAAGSYGSRGLATKKGFDSSYIEPNTVVRGSMDPELLRKILREYIPQFRHCYQQELVHHSEKIKGIVELDFTINAKGKASRYAVNMKDAKFSKTGIKCMGSVLKVIDFPKPKGGGIVDVTQPLNFLAEKSKL